MSCFHKNVNFHTFITVVQELYSQQTVLEQKMMAVSLDRYGYKLYEFSHFLLQLQSVCCNFFNLATESMKSGCLI